ncbi:MAG: GbsR/MarR family transcriptional regulator, partial [Halanaerobiales bacterium]
MDIDHIMELNRNIILESFGGAVGSYGMNETIGRIYGLLYMEDEPLSLKKIADQLGVSKATISINIRLLLELKMVQKVWQKGSRKDFYTAERDFEKIIQEIIRNKEMKLAALIKDAIARAG